MRGTKVGVWDMSMRKGWWKRKANVFSMVLKGTYQKRSQLPQCHRKFYIIFQCLKWYSRTAIGPNDSKGSCGIQLALNSGSSNFPHKQDCYFTKDYTAEKFSQFLSFFLLLSFPPIWVNRCRMLDWGVKLLWWLLLHWRVLCVCFC